MKTPLSTASIPLLSGSFFCPFDPTPESVAVVTWPDIAWGLSTATRFGGQTAVPITVGAHTLCVLQAARRLATPGYGPLGHPASPGATAIDREVAVAALLHDASEAILGDIPSPFKRHPAYAAVRAVEETLQRALNVRFGAAPDAHHHPIVKEADTFALAVEAWLGHGGDVRDWGYEVPERWHALQDVAWLACASDNDPRNRERNGYLSPPRQVFNALLNEGFRHGLCSVREVCWARNKVFDARRPTTDAPWWPEGGAA